jgi:hypothetical protein
MKTNPTKLLCALILLGAVATATATPRSQMMTYTETGYLTGTLGDNAFSDAFVTLTTVGDTANIVNIEFFYTLAGTTTIQIAGLPTATFTETGTEHFGAIAANVDGNGMVGFVNYGSGLNLIFGNLDTSPIYDLSTAATFTSPAASEDSDGMGYGTDQGTLLITGTSGDATFTATAAVPEPGQVVSMLALSVVGGAGALFKLRRRKSSASPI